MLAVIAARMLPVGNFSLINITAGALGIPLPRLPDRQRDRPLARRPRADRVRRPDRRHRPAAAPANLIVLALVAGAIGAALWWLKRRIARRR